MAEQKCRAKGGPVNCHDPNCPEKQAYYDVKLPSQFVALQEQKQPETPAKTWTNEDTVLFKTIHGSRLYGLNHENSDEDYLTITPTKYVKRKLIQQEKAAKGIKHKIDGNDDMLMYDFASFIKLTHEGSPQALEAMFSRQAVSPFFEPYRQNWFASDPIVVNRYLRTIHRFSVDENEEKRLKWRRHAVRLSFNLEELVYTGRFNPTLSENNVRHVKRIADKPQEQYLKELNSVNPFDLEWTHE
jgi:hypothetical protein